MNDKAKLVELDHRHAWHPYTPMDRWLAEPDPTVIVRAKGAWLETLEGERLFDGNSSWWVASLGHGHPRLLKVLAEQAATLDHCAFGGLTHEHGAHLAAELIEVAPPGLSRVFYTDNGSTSVEVAVKMSVQAQRQWGRPKKTRFVALEGAFHGDSVGAASLGGVEVYRRPFGGILFDCVRVPSPGEGGHEAAFAALDQVLRNEADSIAAVVVEPMVQGAAGMLMYDARYLEQLAAACREADVLLVFDEVFSGYGRTGPMWAGEHAQVTPDLMCLGKAFASLLPMGATLTTERVFDAFRGEPANAFYYGHTFCGHPLGAALAREVLRIYRDEDVLGQVARKSKRIASVMDEIGQLPGVLSTRALGMIGAADLGRGGYLGGLGARVCTEARKRGAYLRPLGDTVYICPPLITPDEELEQLLAILVESVKAASAAGG
jgi:adenosylmethionine-8-amino-7-oxononanoate aminotransferase